jgi:hypothetical protein
VKGTISPSLDIKALDDLGISLGGQGSKIIDFKPSKQSPMNSQTLGGLVPFDKIVSKD